MSTTGFTAKLEVDDGVANAYVKFDGTVRLTLPPESVGEYENSELDQRDDADASDPVKRFEPTPMQELGMLKCELHYSKANHQRIRALLGKKKNWKLTPPDEDGAGAITPLVANGLGFVKDIEEIVFEKETPVAIKFSVRPSKKWSFS